MTAQYKTQTLVFMLFIVFVAFTSATSGYASTDIKPGEARLDEANQIIGYNISNLSYVLLPQDPNKLASIEVTVTSENGSNTAEYVSITLDQGLTWENCNHLSGMNWKCDFSQNSQHAASHISQLRVVATD
ncbi:MAG: hypothetical protein FVQ83_07685 [Chloroflexi bacterium]|nr:hypothetical protein [Chloroflexota bacterium]